MALFKPIHRVLVVFCLLYMFSMFTMFRRMPMHCDEAKRQLKEKGSSHVNTESLAFVAMFCGETLSRNDSGIADSVLKVAPSSAQRPSIVPLPLLPKPPDELDVAQRQQRFGHSMPTAQDVAEYNRSLVLSCEKLTGAIVYVDKQAFARGFSKAAWRARLGDREFVVKRAADDSDAGQRSFFLSLKQELKFFMRIGRHPSVLEYYGSCHTHRAPSNAIAVEGPLVAWREVISSRLTWSVRLRLAASALHLLALLADRAMIHCDWKPDQIAVSRDFVVKLVDLKSLRYHGSQRTPWLSSVQCSDDAACQGTCFKWALQNGLSTPDLRCVAGRCAGLAADSMMHASAQLLLWPLLEQRRVDAPSSSGDFGADVDTLLARSGAEQRAERWSARRALTHVEHMQQKYEAAAHLDAHWERAQAALTQIAQQFWSSAEERCKTRFC